MNQYLPIRNSEKNKYGEVLTPPQLIEQILDHLPNMVWSNPRLTWIDPTCGTGNFMIVVYIRLMTGLADWQPDEPTRSQHIIENMLYMVELNQSTAKIARDLFGSNANIIEGDFLTTNFVGKRFDIIVGNPPFQAEVSAGKRTSGKNKLYEQILLKCIQLLNQNGYLSFITPDNLFSGGSKTYLELITNHIVLISFDKSLQAYFPKIQQYMCFFVMLRGNPGVTKLIGNNGMHFECTLSNRPLNPVRDWSPYTEKLVNTFLSLQRNDSVYNRGKSMNQYSKHEVDNGDALIYKPCEKIYTNDRSLAIGYGIKKIVVFLISTDLKFETDFDGKYGVGPNTIYIPLTKKGYLLERFLKSNVYRTLALSTKTNRQFLKIKLIEHLDIAKITQYTLKTISKRNTLDGTRKRNFNLFI